MPEFLNAVELMKEKPTHIDSHLFSTDKVPEVRKIAKELAIKNEIPLRNADIDGFEHVEFINHKSYNGVPGLDYVIEYFDDIIKYDFVEVMTHLGYVDKYILDNSSYNIQRAYELDVLTSEKIKNKIRENNVKLVTYKDLY